MLKHSHPASWQPKGVKVVLHAKSLPNNTSLSNYKLLCASLVFLSTFHSFRPVIQIPKAYLNHYTSQKIVPYTIAYTYTNHLTTITTSAMFSMSSSKTPSKQQFFEPGSARDKEWKESQAALVQYLDEQEWNELHGMVIPCPIPSPIANIYRYREVPDPRDQRETHLDSSQR